MPKRTTATAAAALIAMQALAAPAFALSEEQKAGLAAAALLGIAALSHHQHHYRDDAPKADANYKAMFERGYRDGLHNESYDSRHNSAAYSQGYDAGQKERSNRLAYKTSNIGGTKVPTEAVNSCVTEVASSLNVSGHHVHVIKAGQEGANNFYIELAAGHRHLVCGTDGAGAVFNLRDGRL
ncbi:MAG: hypothetical protein NXH83_10635 [Rhodobacteraceae bacterium]|nr:hypothetical protein [Paracoccaceae bacterium]